MTLRDLLPEIMRLTGDVVAAHVTITRGDGTSDQHRTQIRFVPDRSCDTHCRVERRFWAWVAPDKFQDHWERDGFTIDDVMAVDWTMDERG